MARPHPLQPSPRALPDADGIRTLLLKSPSESPNSASFGLTPAAPAGTIVTISVRRTLRESIWLCEVVPAGAD